MLYFSKVFFSNIFYTCIAMKSFINYIQVKIIISYHVLINRHYMCRYEIFRSVFRPRLQMPILYLLINIMKLFYGVLLCEIKYGFVIWIYLFLYKEFRYYVLYDRHWRFMVFLILLFVVINFMLSIFITIVIKPVFTIHVFKIIPLQVYLTSLMPCKRHVL